MKEIYDYLGLADASVLMIVKMLIEKPELGSSKETFVEHWTAANDKEETQFYERLHQLPEHYQRRFESLPDRRSGSHAAVVCYQTALPCKHVYEWVVYGTAEREGWLWVQCIGCGGIETIDDPSQQEWTDALYASSRPYCWHDSNRSTEALGCP